MASYAFISNRFSKVLSIENCSFSELAAKFRIPIISHEKDGLAIFPGNYHVPFRGIENVTFHNLLALDVDEHSEAEKLFALARDHESQLYRYNFVVYSTFSSIPDSRRGRLLIECAIDDPTQHINLEDYTAATRTIESELGITFDKSTHRRNSFVYTPNVRPQSEYFFFSHTNGDLFTKSDINPEFYKKIAFSPDDPFNLLYTQRPDEQIPTETLARMIAVLDPSMGRQDWLRILAALHHHSGGSDEIFQLVDTWSSKSKTNYVSTEDVRNVWDSIHDKHEELVTIGTFIYLANQNNWFDQYQQDIFAEMRKRITGADAHKECLRIDQMYKFCEDMSKHKFRNFELVTLIEELITAHETINSIKLGARAKKELRIDLTRRARFGGPLRSQSQQHKIDQIPTWARRLVIATNVTQDPVFIEIHKPLLSHDSINIINDRQFNVKFRDFKLDNEEDLAKKTRDNYQLPIVTSVAFDPKQPTIFERAGEFHLNSFQATETLWAPDVANLSPLQKKIRESIYRFITYYAPDPKIRVLLMNYFAYNIFNFGHKAIWAPYFISTEGYGKDTFIDLIQLALGNYSRHFLKTDGYQFLNPQWTSALEHKAFVFVNEVYASVGQSGAKAEQAWHLVKDRITNETSIRISTKYQTDRNIQQPTNYAFASNTTNGLRYSKTERRLLVVHLDRHHKNENFRDAKNAVSEDFDLIYRIFDQCSILPNTIRTSPNEKREIREAVLTVFRDFSPKETWDADFNPRGHAYQTPEFLEIANYIVEPHEAAFEEILEDHEVGFVTPQTIFYTPLRQLVQGYFESRRILHQFSDQKLKDIIRTRGYIAVAGTNVTLKHILKDQAMHYKMPVSPVYVSSSYHQLDWQLKHKDIYSYLRSLYSIYEQQLISNEFDVIPSEPQDGEFLQ